MTPFKDSDLEKVQSFLSHTPSGAFEMGVEEMKALLNRLACAEKTISLQNSLLYASTPKKAELGKQAAMAFKRWLASKGEL